MKRTQQQLVITTQEQMILKKVLKNQFRKIVYALELTKERFLICKKCAKVLLCEFGKENYDFREDGGQKIELSSLSFSLKT